MDFQLRSLVLDAFAAFAAGAAISRAVSVWQAVDRDYGNDARSLGASEVRIFLRLILPRAWPYLLLAVVVALFIPLSGLL